jgi:hypothetical protein
VLHQKYTRSLSPLGHIGLLVHHTAITESCPWIGRLLSRLSVHASGRPGSAFQASGSSPEKQPVSALPAYQTALRSTRLKRTASKTHARGRMSAQARTPKPISSALNIWLAAPIWLANT